MSNPNGPYPGRQLFIGLSADGRASLAYLVTGRSPSSRERTAIPVGNGVVIGPVGQQEYDPLRHYTGALFHDRNEIAVVSNGIQTEAIFEAYRLLYNVDSPPDESYMQKLLEGAGAEPDSLQTPRIAGIITRQGDSGRVVYMLGIKRADQPASTLTVAAEPGVLFGVSTYQGDMSNPAAFDIGAGPARLEFDGDATHDLAGHLYDMSEATNEGEDIRVCAIGAMRSVEDDAWDVAIKNRRQVG